MAVVLSNFSLFLAINWGHDGSIMDLGFYDLRWYSLLFAAGFGLSFLLLTKKFKVENVPEKKLDTLLFYMVFATILGARLGHCLFYEFDYYSNNLTEIFLPFRFSPHLEFTGFRGLASHGGAIGILIAIFLYSKTEKLNIFWVMDQLALVIPLACGFVRFGNLFNSEMVGNPTSVPWAVVFLQLDNVSRHPSQVYEAIAYFSIFLILNLLSQRVKKHNGFLFGLFLFLMFSARFVLEFFKIDQVAFESGMALNMGQWLSIPFIIVGIFLMVRKQKVDALVGVSNSEEAH